MTRGGFWTSANFCWRFCLIVLGIAALAGPARAKEEGSGMPSSQRGSTSQKLIDAVKLDWHAVAVANDFRKAAPAPQ